MSLDDPAAVGMWTELIDDMDRKLAIVTDQLATTGSVVPAPAFEPPAGLPPLPVALRPRVRFLLERTGRVEQLVSQRAGEVGRRISATAQQQAESRPVRPAFFDRAF